MKNLVHYINEKQQTFVDKLGEVLNDETNIFVGTLNIEDREEDGGYNLHFSQDENTFKTVKNSKELVHYINSHKNDNLLISLMNEHSNPFGVFTFDRISDLEEDHYPCVIKDNYHDDYKNNILTVFFSEIMSYDDIEFVKNNESFVIFNHETQDAFIVLKKGMKDNADLIKILGMIYE